MTLASPAPHVSGVVRHRLNGDLKVLEVYPMRGALVVVGII